MDVIFVQFCGETGMILEMDNSKGKCDGLKGMDVSWLSRFAEEEERYVYK